MSECRDPEPDFIYRLGSAHTGQMGAVHLWYDEPVIFEVRCPALEPMIIGMRVPDTISTWIDASIGLHLQSQQLALAKAGSVDFRTLMTRPDASLWRIDPASDDALCLRPILEPVHDILLPSPGLFWSDFLPNASS